MNGLCGIGTDILSLERFRNVLDTGGDAFIQEVFSRAEQDAALLREDKENFYATRFAGKEAVFKCLGTTWVSGLVLREIEILETPSGAPEVRLHGNAREAALKAGIGKILLSLSFERDYAVAMAASLAMPQNI